MGLTEERPVVELANEMKSAIEYQMEYGETAAKVADEMKSAAVKA